LEVVRAVYGCNEVCHVVIASSAATR
jgi:hypothetical protein